MALVEVEAPAELVVPEIPTVETKYDYYENNRAKLIKVLESNTLQQSFGSWSHEGKVCILEAAYRNISK